VPRPYGVYVHFPWCERKCPYCDFAVSVDRPVPGARYARAVLAEMGLRAPAFAGLSCVSLYLGGGTPSLWEAEHVAAVVSAVRRLGLSAGAEVTLEANPESVDAPRLAAWRAAGVNRVSIGVQSFDAAVLAKLGRRHGPEAAERAVREARRAFENVSVDLIYGGRRSTVETARTDAARAARLGAAHVSAYALTLDPEVLAEEVPFARLARTGRLVFPGEVEVLAQARAVRSALRRAGLARYEISNFARPGFASVHNRLYWAGESYLGLGVGAVGCLHHGDGAVRWTDHRTPAAWLAAVESGRLPTAAEERLGAGEVRNERLMLALRTARGLDARLLPGAKRGEVDALVGAGLASRRGVRIVLTARGLDVHSAVAERLMS
jgi:oxygen-independent coproporphyrinogen-3 oxidase